MDEPRIIRFDVSVKSIYPSIPLYAGRVGEHNAARVDFVIAPELISPDYAYQVEYIDSSKHWDTVPPVTLADGENTVSVPLINGWTQAAGISIIRLVIRKPPDEMIMYSYDGLLDIKPRETGDQQIVTPVIETGLTALMEDTKAAGQEARDAAANLQIIDSYREV